MSLKPTPTGPIPEETVRLARLAFPKGNRYMRLRDELGPIYEDEDFAELFPRRGKPAYPPWRLALVTIMQYMENLSDRQTADAVRARIDWKYALGLPVGDDGFDFSILSTFRQRLTEGGKEHLLLDKMLDCFCEKELLKARGKQRTDSTHILGKLRDLNRLELLGETLRAALNELATHAPDWLEEMVEPYWFHYYSARVEERRLPHTKLARESYARLYGKDGFKVLDKLDASDEWAHLRELPQVKTLRTVWKQHYERSKRGEVPSLKERRGRPAQSEKRIESPYETEARYRSKRGTKWTGYMVHLTETCDEDEVHLITDVKTTPADEHEVGQTAAIQEALAEKGLLPEEHLADSGYIDAELLVEAEDQHGVRLVGPPRKDPSWQSKTKGAYDLSYFDLDWDQKEATCPQGKTSRSWKTYTNDSRGEHVVIRFRPSDCQSCPDRILCTTAKKGGRALRLNPQKQHAALQKMREFMDSAKGIAKYGKRAGVEGSISEGVRAYGLRHARYRGLAKTHLQHVATAAAMNMARTYRWLAGVPHETTRSSPFTALSA